jgi:hypothetical protein
VTGVDREEEGYKQAMRMLEECRRKDLADIKSSRTTHIAALQMEIFTMDHTCTWN